MALPFLSTSSSRKRDSILAVDLGGRTTKAVHVQRKGNSYVLSGYVLQDAPIYEKNISAEMLGEHLKTIAQSLDLKGKSVTLALSVADSIVRPAELPMMPVGDMRQVLKMNAKNYMQQDMPGYAFDCFVMPTHTGTAVVPPPSDNKAQPASLQKIGVVVQKLNVLVGGARQQLLGDVQEAVRSAGLLADSITPGLVGPVNAFELAMPEIFARENVALIDIGFKNTTICILREGELALSRVVNIGGDRLTAALAETLSLSYSEAEGLKVGMPADVHPHLEALLTSLGRELRASIDYFEHQQDKTVTQVFVSGGSARSEQILQSLQAELMVECKTWNPVGFMQNSLPPAQLAELDAVASQLTIAVGAAVAAL